VVFDQVGGETIVRRIREAELTQDIWRSAPPRGEKSPPTRPAPSTSTVSAPDNLFGVLIAIVAVGGFGAWLLGAALWYPGHQFDYPGGATGKLALPTWLGGFSAITGGSAALMAARRLLAGELLRTLAPAVAAAVCATIFWVITPAIAHQRLNEPYATRGEAQQSAEQLLERSLDYRTPNWREPSFVAVADYTLRARCAASPRTQSPSSRVRFHVWSCRTTASYQGKLLCRALMTGYEIYRRHTVLLAREHRCHNPGVVFIPPTLAAEWAEQSQPRTNGWRCHISAGLPHDPMGNGYVCRSGTKALSISPLTTNTWQWRSAS